MKLVKGLSNYLTFKQVNDLLQDDCLSSVALFLCSIKGALSIYAFPQGEFATIVKVGQKLTYLLCQQK